LTLTYDHRLVDGALAGRFCATCAAPADWGEEKY